MAYPGGKGAVYQTIINLIPPHRTYIEPFAGGAAIARYKRPAHHNILIERDSDVITTLEDIAEFGDTSAWTLINGCAIGLLAEYRYQGDEFVYLDPPYVISSRRQHRPIYRYELADDDHIRLLDIIVNLPCKVMISGYWTELYADRLKRWHTVAFEAQTRGGSTATEWLWMNYPQPTRLHDYSYVGDNFRERERIKRKAERWFNRFQALPVLERQAILAKLDNLELNEPL